MCTPYLCHTGPSPSPQEHLNRCGAERTVSPSDGCKVLAYAEEHSHIHCLPLSTISTCIACECANLCDTTQQRPTTPPPPHASFVCCQSNPATALANTHNPTKLTYYNHTVRQAPATTLEFVPRQLLPQRPSHRGRLTAKSKSLGIHDRQQHLQQTYTTWLGPQLRARRKLSAQPVTPSVSSRILHGACLRMVL